MNRRPTIPRIPYPDAEPPFRVREPSPRLRPPALAAPVPGAPPNAGRRFRFLAESASRRAAPTLPDGLAGPGGAP